MSIFGFRDAPLRGPHEIARAPVVDTAPGRKNPLDRRAPRFICNCCLSLAINSPGNCGASSMRISLLVLSNTAGLHQVGVFSSFYGDVQLPSY
ncbi:MAG: hypothetical protein Q8939_19570 [Bacteroidota bacterium]|nr:hypothetical protein [Bacteroidota bacterium]